MPKGKGYGKKTQKPSKKKRPKQGKKKTILASLQDKSGSKGSRY